MVENNNSNNSIPEMNIDNKYDEKKQNITQNSTQAQKEMEKTKKEVEKLKNFIIKKYPFTQALGILPPQSIPTFIEEEEIPKEVEKHIHLYMIVPEDKLKKIPEIKKTIVEKIDSLKQKIWLQIKTPIDIWEGCTDSKFEITNAIGMSFPLYDKGILAGLRVAEIHKSLVLQKFEKYVVSYVIAGSLVRGDATKTSDVDVFVVINDTDVKRMPRLELKERLRSIIFQYIGEANHLAGMKNNILNVQPYLLTEFWDAVKDANPVMFTFIRDGVPLYDRGTFMPWKALLKMGKLKPSPEAIDMFMSMGDGVVPRSKKTLLSEIFTNIFWGVATPAQAIVMLNGGAPPNPKKELVPEFKKEFLAKKMIEKKYVDFLEKIIKTWRDYEHEKIKEISGAEIDKLLKETEEFINRLKELRKDIEKKAQEKTIEQINKDIFELLKTILGKKSQSALIEDFDKILVKKGKFPPSSLRILQNIIDAKKEFKKGKSNSHKIDTARKNATILINDLIEYSQRCDLALMDKGKMMIKFGKDQTAELFNADNKTFLVQN
ncbi:MAG: nucleotidyltransferase domain-containing protein, partial [Candidatus Pacearchaeota archaeon]|nr:nucleotidyltransferase domain-containing protein [Candidatus Pacearchaeota archaeon]